MAQPAMTNPTSAVQNINTMAANLANAKLDAITMGAVPTQDNLQEAVDDTINEMRRRLGTLPVDLAAWLLSVLQYRIHKPGTHLQLVDRTAHAEWFLESGVYVDAQRPPPMWQYWKRYERMLLDKSVLGRKREAADVLELDRASNAALGCLMDPTVPGKWDILGMVVGMVQSGKTQHFGALMNKAADVGYKLVIVLAGTTKDLRWQTQRRIDEDFRGKETWNEANGPMATVGVGHFNAALSLQHLPEPESWTQSDFNSEFGKKESLVSLLGKLSPDSPTPVYMVVKKNVTALRKLKRHFENLGGETLAKFPALVIDDECDHASVNTKYKGKDVKKEVKEEDPTKINRLIRDITNLFARRSYVGYTATPFANVFIPFDPALKVEEMDLYPKDFIMTLDPPSTYVGAERVFGLKDDPGHKIVGVEPIGMVRYLPAKDIKTFEENESGVPLQVLPGTLRDAILGFFIATAAHRERMKDRQFATMLIHVAGTNAPQWHVYNRVLPFLTSLKTSISTDPHSPFLMDMKRLWEEEYVPYSLQHMADNTPGIATFPIPDFQALVPVIRDEIGRVQLKLVNQTKKEDILDYSKGPQATPPYIAIGGNKLSRGFTMEGLHTSYYVRSPDAADTLMQMGRWFGYRPNYLDFCRVYTTKEIEEKFQYIANATTELRMSFKRLHAAKQPPSAFAYEVREHEAQLIDITASNKKKFAKKGIVANLQGRTPHTMTFDVDDAVMRANLDAADRLLSKVKKYAEETRNTGVLDYWLVDAKHVLEFLDDGFKVSQHEVNPYLLSTIGRYVTKRNGADELSKFWVAVHKPKGSTKTMELPQFGKIHVSSRPYEKNSFEPELGYVKLNALEAPEDFEIGMADKDYQAALAETRKSLPTASKADKPTKDTLLKHRDRTHGVLVLYFVDPVSSFTDQPYAGPSYNGPNLPLAAFMAAFPGDPQGPFYTVGHVAGGKVT